MVQYSMCVFYFEFLSKCSLCNDHFHYMLVALGVLCEMCSYLLAIFGCLAEGLSVVSVIIVLPIPPCYCFLFSFGVDLFLFEFGGSCC